MDPGANTVFMVSVMGDRRLGLAVLFTARWDARGKAVSIVKRILDRR